MLLFPFNVAVILACFSLTRMVTAEETGSSGLYTVCNKLGYQTLGSDTNILTVGQINSYILLITKDFYVFEISSNAIKGKQNLTTMYLESKPEMMSKKWPVLWNNTSFTKIKDQIYNSFTVTDAKNEYVFFTTKLEKVKESGVTYDIQNNKVYRGLRYLEHDDQVMISAKEKLIFYAINSDGNGLRIGKYKFKKNTIHQGLTRDNDWQRLCAVYDNRNTNKSKLPSKIMVAYRCEHELKWPVYRGFHDAQQFYLFGPKNYSRIIIFIAILLCILLASLLLCILLYRYYRKRFRKKKLLSSKGGVEDYKGFIDAGKLRNNKKSKVPINEKSAAPSTRSSGISGISKKKSIYGNIENNSSTTLEANPTTRSEFSNSKKSKLRKGSGSKSKRSDSRSDMTATNILNGPTIRSDFNKK